MLADRRETRRAWLRAGLTMLLLLIIAGAYVAWDRGFREEPQPAWVFESPDMRFKYGSIGAEHDAGIPYWIFYVLPRVFPEKFRQDGQTVPGGYAALGVSWEQGQELPAGFTKKTIGFPRVANNCAACHTTSYRKSADSNPVFDAQCARCHASERTGTRIPLNEVGTDQARLDTWNKGAAIKANQVVTAMGIPRKGLVEEDLNGYKIPFLDGIWLRAPYLHNGSVPTLRDLLEPAAARPKIFWNGYDVYDPQRVGFITDGDEARRVGTHFDTAAKGGGNQGHEFGSVLPAGDKEALLEYLKTL